MPTEDIKAPSRRSLVTVATAAVLLASAVVGYGFMTRAQSKQEVVQWTNTQAIPTVALAQLIPGGTHQTLTLPGNIQPFNKAAIFARVNGYVKSWDNDIGSSVKAGQVLGQIDKRLGESQVAQFRGAVDGCDRFLIVGRSVEFGHAHAAETNRRNRWAVASQPPPCNAHIILLFADRLTNELAFRFRQRQANRHDLVSAGRD